MGEIVTQNPIPDTFTFAGIDFTLREIRNFPQSFVEEKNRWLPLGSFDTHRGRNYCNECEDGYGGWKNLVANHHIYRAVVKTTQQKVMDIEQFNLLRVVIQKQLEAGSWMPTLTDGLAITDEHTIAYKGPSDLFKGSKTTGLVQLPGKQNLIVVSPVVTGFVYIKPERIAHVYPEFAFKDDLTDATRGIAVAIRNARLTATDIPHITFA